MSQPSKAAARAMRRIAPHVTQGEVQVRNPGQYHETVTAVIHGDVIEVHVQNGVAVSHHTCPVGAVGRPEEDYFPGSYWSSLSQAIAACLPDERASVSNPHGLGGYVTVDIHRRGVALKPEAHIVLSLEDGSYFHRQREVKKVKAGPLLALCQQFVASKGDTAVTAALLDWLEENSPEVADYLQAVRAWPAKKATTPPERRPGYEAWMSS